MSRRRSHGTNALALEHIVAAREFWHESLSRPNKRLKNHVSPVRFWPSAQNAFAGLFIALSSHHYLMELARFVKKGVTEHANHLLDHAPHQSDLRSSSELRHVSPL
jgi:hypothetical protein